MESKVENVWAEIGNLCLIQALNVLEGEQIPNIAHVEIAERLVNIAIAIDKENLEWERFEKNRHSVMEAPRWISNN